MCDGHVSAIRLTAALVAPSLSGECAAGHCLGPRPMLAETAALPTRVWQGGPELAAATGETPSPVAAVSQLAGAP